MTAIRKLLAFLLAFAMLLSCTGAVFGAAASDLEGHWSQPYMEDLYDRNMISGYSDGTMRPDRDITAGEALVFLSHFYQLNETELNAVWEDYGDAAQKVTTTQWIQSPLAVCLASGITTYNEAKGLNLSSPVSKEQLSVFLVRAMQMEATASALEDTELPFDDKESVSADCKGSVALLSQLKIVSGNTAGEFCPQSNVTRAVVATMVCKILDYLEENNITLKLSGYTGLSLAEGVLNEVASNGVTVRDFSGIYRFFPFAAACTASMDGKSIALDDDYEDAYASLRLMDGKVTAISLTDPDDEEWEQGRLKTVNAKTTSVTVYEEDDDTETYDLSRATVYLNDKEDILANLPAGCFVNLKDIGDRIYEVRAYSNDVTVSGTITGISNGTTIVISLDVADDPGVELCLHISSLPTIKRGSLKVSADKLMVGDVLEATISGGEVDQIVVNVSSVSRRGTIKSVLTSADGTGWALTMEDGSEETYTLAKNVVAYEGKTTIDLSTLTFGDEVSVVVQDDEIVSVTLEKLHEGSTAQSADYLQLEVLYVSTKDKTVACKDAKGGLVYLVCTSAKIVDTTSGKDISLASLDAGDEILVWGTYNKDGQIAVSTIIR